MVLRPAELVVSRSLRKTLRRGGFEVRLDTAFHRVVHRCAKVPRRGEAGTWITSDIANAYAAFTNSASRTPPRRGRTANSSAVSTASRSG